MPETLFDMSAPRRTRVASESLEEQLVSAGLPRPRREYFFAKQLLGRDWRFDWCWDLPFKIALEIDGGTFGRAVCVGVGAFYRKTDRKTGEKIRVPVEANTWVRLGGRHNAGEGMKGEYEKLNYAAMLGWLVVRATPDDVRTGDAVKLAIEAFTFRRKYCPLSGHTEFPELQLRTPAPQSAIQNPEARRPRPAAVPW